MIHFVIIRSANYVHTRMGYAFHPGWTCMMRQHVTLWGHTPPTTHHPKADDMSVSLVKHAAKHAQCDTWQDYAPRCTHPDHCDRLVLITMSAHVRAFVSNMSGFHVSTQPTAHPRHAA